ncbi:DoxX family membrane protein [Mucilaginibacter sp. JRF]|uniref:DoxX family membrane protein n=1 Tax=Mucilaginibacter sp. JRF TaxID=2780088 RepID=UPI00188182DE|nr:DoxX family membrane protein [Mucilaginibacter sp. JRF]MBE9582820.1 DoxX family membrane protein [Mucilaginibacter sp. JRF]
MNNPQVSYLLARLPIAVSMLGHGLARMPKLDKFSGWMVGEFSQSVFPQGMVHAFAYLLPFAELLVGVLLLIGLFTRYAIVGGAVIMLMLIFGSSTIEQWNNVFIQMLYGLYFAVLYYFLPYNSYAIDSTLRKH